MFLKPLVRSLVAASLLTVNLIAPSWARDDIHLIRDAEIEKYLRDFTDPILEAAKLRPEDVHLYVLSDTSINAFVANGQNIHLNVGLIMETETPGQLIGVIAHETGHIAGAHIPRMSDGLQAANRTALATIGLGILAIAAGAGDAGAAIIASSQKFAYNEFAKYSRAQEGQADQAALTYLERTGRSPAGLIEFFSVFRSQQVYSNAKRQEFYMTHPLAADRMAYLRQRAEETGLMDVPEPADEMEKLQRMKAKLIGYIEDAATVKAAYPDDDNSIYANYARAINQMRYGFHASAIAQTEKLLAAEPDNPYFYELLAQVYFEKRDFDAAVDANRTSVELAPTLPLLKLNLATSLLHRDAEGDLDEAGELLEWVKDREPDNPSAWYYLATVRGKQGRTGEADLAVAEQAYAYEDCQRASIFARRALDTLEKNTPAHLRASDITKRCAIGVYDNRFR